ncbi:hypothetical protein DZD18_14230 [Rhodobacteraceae bacterium W635]|uniref:hypothetical protein n=1 Tax=Nioella halotolerans TaxID=2303578 RepID=UPI000E3D099B|nr:hypothetical protein DZD18_14230 [Rhodobacteraceae bacterium W635]
MAGTRQESILETRSDRLLPVLSLFLIALIYLLTFPQNFTEAEDAVHYAAHVAAGAPQWHPNHLLYEPLMAALTRATQVVWPGARGLVIMQLASLAALIWTLALVWKIARVAGGGLWGAMASVWLLAGCFAVWLYGLYPDTYTLPLPFVLASFLALWQVGWEGGGARAAALGGFLAAIATLLHQSHVFMAIPMLIVLLAARRVRLAVLWLGVFGLVVGAVYLWAGWGLLGHRSLPALFDWARGYAADGLWTPLSWLAPVKALVGLGTAIWSGLFLFAIPALSDPIEALFGGRLLVEEMHFARTGLRLPAPVLAALSGISIVAVAALAIRAIVAGGQPLTWGFRPLLMLHGATYAIVTTIWEPTNKEFWIAALPFLVLLLVLRLDPARRWIRRAVGIASLSLWLANGAGAMLGFAEARTDHWHVLHADLLAEVQPGDVVVDDCGYICTGYLLLFSPAELLPVSALGRAAETGPGRILLTSRARDALDAQAPEGWAASRASLDPVIEDARLSLFALPR